MFANQDFDFGFESVASHEAGPPTWKDYWRRSATFTHITCDNEWLKDEGDLISYTWVILVVMVPLETCMHNQLEIPSENCKTKYERCLYH